MSFPLNEKNQIRRSTLNYPLPGAEPFHPADNILCFFRVTPFLAVSDYLKPYRFCYIFLCAIFQLRYKYFIFFGKAELSDKVLLCSKTDDVTLLYAFWLPF